MNSTLGRWHFLTYSFLWWFFKHQHVCVLQPDSCDSNSDFEITSRCRDRIFDTRLRGHFGDQRCETWIIICLQPWMDKVKNAQLPFGTFPPWLPWQPLEHDVHLLVKRSDPKTLWFLEGSIFHWSMELLRGRFSAPNFSWNTHFSPWPMTFFKETTLFLFWWHLLLRIYSKITKQPKDIISSHDVMSPWSWHCLVYGISLWLSLPTWSRSQWNVNPFLEDNKNITFGREEVVCFFCGSSDKNNLTRQYETSVLSTKKLFQRQIADKNTLSPPKPTPPPGLMTVRASSPPVLGIPSCSFAENFN